LVALGGCGLLNTDPTVIHELPPGFTQPFTLLIYNCANGLPLDEVDENQFLVPYGADGVFLTSTEAPVQNTVISQRRHTDGTTTRFSSDGGGSGIKSGVDGVRTCTHAHGYYVENFYDSDHVERFEDALKKACARCDSSATP